MLRLRAFGGCFMERNGIRVDDLSGRKALALLSFLAAVGTRGASRDTMLALLWPESDEERARTSLRQLLHSLRAQLQEPSLFVKRGQLRLNPEKFSSDVADFHASLQKGDLAAAVALYSGPFLDGFYLSGADEFERWLSSERAALAAAAASAMQSLAEQEQANGNSRAAIEIWRRLARLDPLSANATIGLMSALDSIGERAAALQHARDYESMVRSDFGDYDPGVSRMAADLEL